MPQMAPIMWMILFMFFMIMLILSQSKTYFNLNEIKKTKNILLFKEKNQIKWMW